MRIKCGYSKDYKVWTVCIFKDPWSKIPTEVYAHESLLKCLKYVEGIK